METKSTWTLARLAEILGATLSGPPDLEIDGPGPAEQANPRAIAFAENEAYLAQAEQNVGAVIVGQDFREPSIPHLRVPVPRLAFFQLLHLSQRPLPLNTGVHPTAVVDPEAKLGEGVQIGAHVVIERGAEIGDGAQIFAHCYVGENCKIGPKSILYPRVTLVHSVTIGARCILHSGCVLGADGFGFVWDGTKRIKVPQIGQVQMGDDVEIGANTTIDRATAGVTRIGNGTKLDNLIQVGHNCEIGDHGVFAGMCGLAGSTKVGHRAVWGGNVGTNDHVTITDDVTLGGRSGVDRDITEPGEYFGTPARPVGEGIRSLLLFTKLPEIVSRIRKLEKKVGL